MRHEKKFNIRGGGKATWGLGFEAEIAILIGKVEPLTGEAIKAELEISPKEELYSEFGLEEGVAYPVYNVLNVKELFKAGKGWMEDETKKPNIYYTDEREEEKAKLEYPDKITNYLLRPSPNPIILNYQLELLKNFTIEEAPESVSVASAAASPASDASAALASHDPTPAGVDEYREERSLLNRHIKENVDKFMIEDIPGNLFIVEAVTKKHKNANIVQLLEELKFNKKVILDLVRLLFAIETSAEQSLCESIRYYDSTTDAGNFFRSYSVYTGRLGKVVISYPGSYHINVSVPYVFQTEVDYGDTKLKVGEEFRSIHDRLAVALQFLQPLLIAVYSLPDYFSFNDDDRYTESSFRLMKVAESFVVSTNIIEDGIAVERTKRYEDFKLMRELERLYRNTYLKTTGPLYTYINHKSVGADFRRAKGTSAKPRKKNLGLEFRILDAFYEDYLGEITILIFLLYAWLTRTGYKFSDNPFNHEEVTQALADVFIQGWNTVITPRYIQLLNKNLGFDLEVEEIEAYSLLNNIYKLLKSKYDFDQFSEIFSKSDLPELLTNVNSDAFNLIIDSRRDGGLDLSCLELAHRANIDKKGFFKMMELVFGNSVKNDKEDLLEYFNWKLGYNSDDEEIESLEEE